MDIGFFDARRMSEEVENISMISMSLQKFCGKFFWNSFWDFFGKVWFWKSDRSSGRIGCDSQTFLKKKLDNFEKMCSSGSDFSLDETWKKCFRPQSAFVEEVLQTSVWMKRSKNLNRSQIYSSSSLVLEGVDHPTCVCDNHVFLFSFPDWSWAPA